MKKNKFNFDLNESMVSKVKDVGKSDIDSKADNSIKIITNKDDIINAIDKLADSQGGRESAHYAVEYTPAYDYISIDEDSELFNEFAVEELYYEKRGRYSEKTSKSLFLCLSNERSEMFDKYYPSEDDDLVYPYSKWSERVKIAVGEYLRGKISVVSESMVGNIKKQSVTDITKGIDSLMDNDDIWLDKLEELIKNYGGSFNNGGDLDTNEENGEELFFETSLPMMTDSKYKGLSVEEAEWNIFMSLRPVTYYVKESGETWYLYYTSYSKETGFCENFWWCTKKDFGNQEYWNPDYVIEEGQSTFKEIYEFFKRYVELKSKYTKDPRYNSLNESIVKKIKDTETKEIESQIDKEIEDSVIPSEEDIRLYFKNNPHLWKQIFGSYYKDMQNVERTYDRYGNVKYKPKTSKSLYEIEIYFWETKLMGKLFEKFFETTGDFKRCQSEYYMHQIELHSTWRSKKEFFVRITYMLTDFCDKNDNWYYHKKDVGGMGHGEVFENWSDKQKNLIWKILKEHLRYINEKGLNESMVGKLKQSSSDEIINKVDTKIGLDGYKESLINQNVEQKILDLFYDKWREVEWEDAPDSCGEWFPIWLDETKEWKDVFENDHHSTLIQFYYGDNWQPEKNWRETKTNPQISQIYFLEYYICNDKGDCENNDYVLSDFDKDEQIEFYICLKKTFGVPYWYEPKFSVNESEFVKDDHNVEPQPNEIKPKKKPFYDHRNSDGQECAETGEYENNVYLKDCPFFMGKEQVNFFKMVQDAKEKHTVKDPDDFINKARMTESLDFQKFRNKYRTKKNLNESMVGKIKNKDFDFDSTADGMVTDFKEMIIKGIEEKKFKNIDDSYGDLIYVYYEKGGEPNLDRKDMTFSDGHAGEFTRDGEVFKLAYYSEYNELYAVYAPKNLDQAFEDEEEWYDEWEDLEIPFEDFTPNEQKAIYNDIPKTE